MENELTIFIYNLGFWGGFLSRSFGKKFLKVEYGLQNNVFQKKKERQKLKEFAIS